jgi:hypothetical protein
MNSDKLVELSRVIGGDEMEMSWKEMQEILEGIHARKVKAQKKAQGLLKTLQ